MPAAQRWSLAAVALAILALAVVIGSGDLRQGLLVGTTGGLVLAAVTVWSGRRGRHIPWSRARRTITTDHAVVLWKPGCLYCERLLLQLRGDPQVTWVNVWRDAEANVQVRAVNGGDELTPTALLGEDVLRNPSAAELRAQLTAGAAHPG